MTRLNHRNANVIFRTGAKVKDLRPIKPARERQRRREIDVDALAATLAELDARANQPRPVIKGGANTLPATGYCHVCEKPVTGERRYCGRCLSKRIT